MQLNSLNDLFLCLLSDIYYVENKSIEAIPQITEKVESEKLKNAFNKHFNETKNQLKRLDKIFKILGEKPQEVEWIGDLRQAFSDIESFLEENTPSPLLDASIIGVTERIEHFEIATYATLKECAAALGQEEVLNLLNESLEEEFDAAHKLFKVAESEIFKSAISAEAW